MSSAVIAALVACCLAAPALASVGNGPQEHPVAQFMQVS